jgi:hypothetical protein
MRNASNMPPHACRIFDPAVQNKGLPQGMSHAGSGHALSLPPPCLACSRCVGGNAEGDISHERCAVQAGASLMTGMHQVNGRQVLRTHLMWGAQCKRAPAW